MADLPAKITTPGAGDDTQSGANNAQNQRLARIVSLKRAEVMLIENSLAHHKGNISKAAIALGITRPTLYHKIQAFGIQGRLRDGGS